MSYLLGNMTVIVMQQRTVGSLKQRSSGGSSDLVVFHQGFKRLVKHLHMISANIGY